MTRISNILDSLFNNLRVLSIIKYYNLVILFIYVLGSFLFLYGAEYYQSIYKIFVALLGFNLFSLIPNGYIVAKFKFCDWSKMAYVSNVIICLLELIFSVLEIFIIVPWDGIIMMVVSSVLLAFTTKYFRWKK